MIKNFLFHRVNPERDTLWDPMDVDLFDKCIRYISSKYKVELFENIVNDPTKLKSKYKYATIMFDDGYKDNIVHALPILEKYKVKASFYIVTDCIERNIPTWTYILDYSFQNTSCNYLELNFDYLPQEFHKNAFSTNEERIAFASKLKPFLKKLSYKDRLNVRNAIEKTFDDVKIPEIMMNWDEIRTLYSKGHYIGSHTVSHCMLGTIKDEEIIKYELITSAEVIKKELGYFPRTISYPIGSYNDTVKKLSQEVGYEIGLAVKQKVYNPSKEDIFEVSRMELYNESWLKTKLRILNVVGKIKNIIR